MNAKAAFAMGVVVIVVVIALGVLGAKQRQEEARRVAATQAQVQRWVEQLDGQTTETGVYDRWPGETLPEKDAWETPLRVSYAQGGFAETVAVRSAGPDRTLHTDDDIAEQRSSANLRGVGEGVKKHIEETAQKGARGAGRGLIEGIRDGLKKPDAEEEPDAAPAVTKPAE